MAIEIRLYHKNDYKTCMEAFVSNVPLYFTEDEIKDFAGFLNKMENNDTTERAIYFVIEFNQRVIGCGGYGDKDGNKIISLVWGLIHREFHHKGFGKHLLQYRLEQIKNQYPDFPVVMDTTQYSYKFFERFGFHTTKITPDYYASGMHKYDMILKNYLAI